MDGNDVLAVREAANEAVERARKGEGPSFIECQTYRWMGHFTADDGKYRPDEEVKYWKEERDPIKNFAEVILDDKTVTKKNLDAIHQEVGKEIEEAFNFAVESDFDDPGNMIKGVYYEPAPN